MDWQKGFDHCALVASNKSCLLHFGQALPETLHSYDQNIGESWLLNTNKRWWLFLITNGEPWIIAFLTGTFCLEAADLLIKTAAWRGGHDHVHHCDGYRLGFARARWLHGTCSRRDVQTKSHRIQVWNRHKKKQQQKTSQTKICWFECKKLLFLILTKTCMGRMIYKSEDIIVWFILNYFETTFF